MAAIAGKNTVLYKNWEIVETPKPWLPNGSTWLARADKGVSHWQKGAFARDTLSGIKHFIDYISEFPEPPES